ncbi:class I SAM-dependent methyltransferase [Roseimarinus sediminis]|uniref:class I SAM-dependent methyltransferase n=1 Tax=Roseimarinus sediminis TaxID=1610899 RepID=UPI003D1F5B50
MILLPEADPIGNAIYNYHFSRNNSPVKVASTLVEDEELPPDYFFRTFRQMPKLERMALRKSKGKILDVGAGAGCHSVWMQAEGMDVTALEISQLCCEVMKDRGLKNIINRSVFDLKDSKFDTILLLMNGIGIAGTTQGLENLLLHLKNLLRPGGKILLDSSDLIYLFEQSDGSFLLDINASQYYGEIDYQLSYGAIHGQTFSWLFADHVILSDIAEKNGFKTRVVEYGPHYDYLAELSLI